MSSTSLPQDSRRHDEVAHHWDDKRKSLVRAAAFSPSAPVLGWLTAWGAAIVAAACLDAAGVELGLGLGIASGTGGEDGFAAGFWLAVIQAGAFILGGYAAARIARRNGIRHAVLAGVFALLATGADAITSAARDEPQVVAALGLPYWNETGLGSGFDAVVALVIFAVVALAGAFVGGMLGQTVNLAARKRAEHDLQPVVESATVVPPAEAPPTRRDDVGERRHEADREPDAAPPVTAHTEENTAVANRPHAESGFDLSRSSDDHPGEARPADGRREDEGRVEGQRSA